MGMLPTKLWEYHTEYPWNTNMQQVHVEHRWGMQPTIRRSMIRAILGHTITGILYIMIINIEIALYKVYIIYNDLYNSQ
jgi:hypothetical protein